MTYIISRNIIKILGTISIQLGFELLVRGWACVDVLGSLSFAALSPPKTRTLTLYESDAQWPLRESYSSLTSNDAHTILQSMQQLQDLVGLLARYAVMENLNHKKVLSP
jgi:hypothetical protein